MSSKPKHTCNAIDGSLGCLACSAGVPYDWSRDPGRLLADRVAKSMRGELGTRVQEQVALFAPKYLPTFAKVMEEKHEHAFTTVRQTDGRWDLCFKVIDVHGRHIPSSVPINHLGYTMNGPEGVIRWGLTKIASDVWIVSPSVVIRDALHAFLVLRDVPHPAPWTVSAPRDASAEASDTSCRHEHVEHGKNIPLRHGSYQTRVCKACGAFRAVSHRPPHKPVEGRVGRWRPSSEYAESTKEDENL